MRGHEFVRRIQELGRRRGLEVRWDPRRGKGSHGLLYLGLRKTIVRNPKDELTNGALYGMLRQLGLSARDLQLEGKVRSFTFPANFEPAEEGGFVITFPDVPEAITQGDTLAQALWEAADCLDEAIAGRIVDEEEIPEPSSPMPGHYMIPVPPVMAAKAALYLAMKEAGIPKTDLARRLGCDEKEARRMLDPKHATKVGRLQEALAVLGKNLQITMVEMPAAG